MYRSVFLGWLFFSLVANASQTWVLEGIIDSVSEEDALLTIAHQGIPGVAEGDGEIEVSVSPGDHAIAQTGRRVRGKLTKEADRLHFHSIWPAEKKAERNMMLINRDLTRPRIGQTNRGLLRLGDELPRFALYNQMGNLITPIDWENKLVVLNFIFTRSKVPSMSPATTRRMAELQDRLNEMGHGDAVRILSLSLDPEFDTPGVNYAYLDDMEVDHRNFWLLSGSEKTLDFLRKKIGVVATPSEKTIINHSMVTLIVDREGKIFYRKPGSRWEVEDLLGRLEILLNAR